MKTNGHAEACWCDKCVPRGTTVTVPDKYLPFKEKIERLEAVLRKARECLNMTGHQGKEAVDYVKVMVAEIDNVLKTPLAPEVV